MAAERLDAVELDAALNRHLDDANRMADALVELDRHPGHVLLNTGTPTGRTGERWTLVGPALNGLWRDFDTYRDVLRRAEEVRDRRSRPGRIEIGELYELLVDPTIEVARRAVSLSERGLTGDAERVETTTLEQLAARMHEAYRQAGELVVRCHELSAAALAGIGPLAERVQRSSAEAVALEVGAGEPISVALDACARRVSALERVASADPLAFESDPPDPELAGLDAQVTDIAERLERMRALQRDWPHARAALATAVHAIDDRRAEVTQLCGRAARRVAGPPPSPPPDRGPALTAALDRLDATSGWPARESGAQSLRRAVADAEEELAVARERASGLLERREELRGRFGAYRARAVRLGRAEEPELIELGDRIRTTLWNRPSDLAAATRDLAAYQRRLAAPADQVGDPARTDCTGGTR